MNEQKAYRWEYDQEAQGFDPAGIGFSVGIYQWLPKASGDGLKKSKTVRVKGYVSEPERVYQRAKALCHKLNAAHVRADEPPPWLQKEYSVPRPSGMVQRRLWDDLTGSQVRSIRLRVMKEHLLPQGFVKGNDGTYVRDRQDQIHLIDFQPAMFGHEYTVNLGFHYTFIPGFFQHRQLRASEFHLLDCVVSQRIGRFVADGRDVWFAYGDDRDALKAKFVQNASDCLAIFERFARRWADPQWWISRSRSMRPWEETLNGHDLDLFRACIAAHLGQESIAEARLQRLIKNAKRDHDREFYRRLLRKVRRKNR